MKQKISFLVLLFIFGFFSFTSKSFAASVSITSPNGGETWSVGETHNVTWTAVGVDYVKIYIYDSNVSGSGSTDYITPNGDSVVASSGSYSWTIGTPHVVAPGSNYRIRIDAVDVNGTVLVDGFGTEIRSSSANIFSVLAMATGTIEEKKKPKPEPRRSVSNSKKTVMNGSVLIQRGKRFSKNSIVQLYFTKPSGNYYAPVEIKTTKTGAFAVSYVVKKPRGKYKWYAVDTKTGKKSKTLSYTVK